MVASDAAPDYGFGVCAAEAPAELVAEPGRFSERRGDYVRLNRDSGIYEPERPRIGQPRHLPLVQHDFRDILSIKAVRPEHAGVMEIKAALMALKWALRAPKRFHTRLVMLIDAKATVCCLAKGRSGAAAFKGPAASFAAHVLASDVLIRPLYIPSEDNPADAPSRGRRRRPLQRGVLKKPGYIKATGDGARSSST